MEGGRRRRRTMRGGFGGKKTANTKLTQAPSSVASSAPNIYRGTGSRSLAPRGEIEYVQTMNPFFGKAGTAGRASDDLPYRTNPLVQRGIIAAELKNEKVMNKVDRLNTAPGNVFTGFNPGFLPRTKYAVEVGAVRDPRDYVTR